MDCGTYVVHFAKLFLSDPTFFEGYIQVSIRINNHISRPHIFFYQAKEYADYQQVWQDDEAKLMRGHIASMILQDKLGSSKALKLLKQDIEKYHPGDDVQIVVSMGDLLDFA